MRATIRVPATVANLGPGFDILALALQLQNQVIAETREDGAITLQIEGDGGWQGQQSQPGDRHQQGHREQQGDGGGSHGELAELHDPARNLVARAYLEACTRLAVPQETRGVSLRCSNAIPFSRGLGSSAAATLSGVLVAVALHRAPWETGEIVECVAAFEGHADNAAAALLGGLVICAPGVDPAHVDLPDEVRAVVFAPHARVATADARRVVAQTLDRGDAIYNASRCALLVRAVLLRDYGALRVAMEDSWHQRQRAPLFPPMTELIQSAYEAGADGACLAGAGPSILALSAHGTEEIEAALRDTAARLSVPGDVLTLPTRNFGARVEVRP